jgi:hypothetical protein
MKNRTRKSKPVRVTVDQHRTLTDVYIVDIDGCASSYHYDDIVELSTGAAGSIAVWCTALRLATAHRNGMVAS